MDYEIAVITLDGNIAKGKNNALRKMLQSDKDYFFLVEENCRVIDDKIYDIFIETSKKTGIEALMWANGTPNKRISFDEDASIEYFSDFSPSFVMFTRNAVESVGFMDEEMPANTWQDLEYAKRIGDLGLSTPFGMFASPRSIDRYFEITKPKDEFKNLVEMDKALRYWEAKSSEDFPIELKKEPKKLEMV